MYDRIATVISLLGQIFIACVPVYIVLVFLERVTNRLGAKLMSVDIQSFFERRIAKLQEKENKLWNDRAEKLGKEND